MSRKAITLDYGGLHLLEAALRRQGIDGAHVGRMIDHYDAQGYMYDQTTTVDVTRKDVSALRLYLAQINRPDLTEDLDQQCNRLFPTQ